jgi:hypothetical protein
MSITITGASALDFADFSITALPGLNLHVCTTNCGITVVTGNASAEFGPGSFNLGPMDFVAGPEAGGVFPAAGTATFSFSELGGDATTGVFNISSVTDDSAFPHMDGLYHVTTSAGSAAFTAAFAPGADTPFDLMMSLAPGACDFTQLVMGDACPAAKNTGITEPGLDGFTISTGLQPRDIVPEPGSSIAFVLVALAMMTLGAWNGAARSRNARK